MSPNFTVDPSWCASSSATTVPADSDITGDVTYDADGSTGPTLTIGPITDRLTPSNPGNDGSTEKTISVTTTFKTCDYDGVCKDTDVVTPVTIKNPCIDPAYVTITAPALFDNEDYTLYDGPEVFGAHGDFVIVTEPVSDHGLCGSLTLTAYYQPIADGDYVTLVADDHPVTYSSTDKVFTAESENLDLIGMTKYVKVIAQFSDYPSSTYSTADTAEQIGAILFKDPCISLVTITSVSQTAFSPDLAFTGETSATVS